MQDDIRDAILEANKNDRHATVVVLARLWLRDYPSDFQVTCYQMEALSHLGRCDEAVATGIAAVERFEGRRVLTCSQLGMVYRYRCDFVQSEKWHHRATEEDPDDAGNFIFLGAVQSRQGRLPEAEATHRRATQCANGCIDEAFHNLGLVLRGQGRFSEAADCFAKALEICPHDENAEDAFEDVTRAMKMLDGKDGWPEAGNELKCWPRVRPSEGDVTSGAADSQGGDERMVLTSTPSVEPGDVHKSLSYCWRNAQAATCVLLAEPWLRDHPDELSVVHDYAETLYLLTRYNEAVTVYTGAIERFPDDRWGIYNQLGHLHQYRGCLKEAERWYRMAMEDDPDEAKSFNFLGNVQARQGKLEEAEETFEQATRCSEDSWVDEAYYGLGSALRGQGRFTDAAESFRKALELRAEYKDARTALGDVESVLDWRDGEDGWPKMPM